MTGHLTDAAPFDSLEAMKARHKDLQRTAPPGESVSELRARVLEFLARGTATGLVLDDPAERRVAQGLLDYWKATLYTQLREAEVEPAAACPTTTVLKDFPEDDSAKLVAAAEGAVESLAPDDRDVARRLLQRLARLEPAVREFHPVAVPRAALDELGNVGQVVRVIHALEKAGVIRSSIAPLGEPRVEVAAGHLIRTWPRYTEWLKDRLAYRTSAYLWQQHNRHSSALMSGPPLAEAASYRDLDAVEADFLKSSRRRAEHMQRVRTRGAFLFLALIILGLIVVVVLLMRLNRLEATQGAINRRVTDINRMMRALSEIVVADTSAEQDLTSWRWEGMEREVRADDEIRKVLDDHEDELRLLRAATGRDWANLDREQRATIRDQKGVAALTIGRALRNRSLDQNDEWVVRMMASVRKVTYGTASHVSEKLVEAAKRQTPLHEVDAYIKEFWRLYWGPLGMVEGPEVETAMVKFGNALRAWERWELKKPRESWPTIREDLARTREELVKALGYDLDKPIRLEKGQLRNQQPQLQKYLSPKN